MPPVIKLTRSRWISASNAIEMAVLGETGGMKEKIIVEIRSLPLTKKIGVVEYKKE